MHELFELFTQSELDDSGSTGDAEEYKRDTETVVFAGALSALLAMLLWSLAIKIWFLCLICSYVVVSR